MFPAVIFLELGKGGEGETGKEGKEDKRKIGRQKSKIDTKQISKNDIKTSPLAKNMLRFMDSGA